MSPPPPRTSFGEGLQGFALLHNGVGVVGCNLGGGRCGNMEVQGNELSFRFRGISDVVHYPARRADLWAAASEARTFSADTARDVLAFMA